MTLGRDFRIPAQSAYTDAIHSMGSPGRADHLFAQSLYKAGPDSGSGPVPNPALRRTPRAQGYRQADAAAARRSHSCVLRQMATGVPKECTVPYGQATFFDSARFLDTAEPMPYNQLGFWRHCDRRSSLARTIHEEHGNAPSPGLVGDGIPGVLRRGILFALSIYRKGNLTGCTVSECGEPAICSDLP